MNLVNKIDQMVGKSGEWLKGKGPSNDVVISSSVRLARNLTGYVFSEYWR